MSDCMQLVNISIFEMTMMASSAKYLLLFISKQGIVTLLKSIVFAAGISGCKAYKYTVLAFVKACTRTHPSAPSASRPGAY